MQCSHRQRSSETEQPELAGGVHAMVAVGMQARRIGAIKLVEQPSQMPGILRRLTDLHPARRQRPSVDLHASKYAGPSPAERSRRFRSLPIASSEMLFQQRFFQISKLNVTHHNEGYDASINPN